MTDSQIHASFKRKKFILILRFDLQKDSFQSLRKTCIESVVTMYFSSETNKLNFSPLPFLLSSLINEAVAAAELCYWVLAGLSCMKGEKERKFFHALFLYSEKQTVKERRERERKEELYQSSLKSLPRFKGENGKGRRGRWEDEGSFFELIGGEDALETMGAKGAK